MVPKQIVRSSTSSFVEVKEPIYIYIIFLKQQISGMSASSEVVYLCACMLQI